MKTNTFYNVTITGQQKHIKGNVYEFVTADVVTRILDEKQDVENCPVIKWDGNSHELNSDLYITIEKIN